MTLSFGSWVSGGYLGHLVDVVEDGCSRLVQVDLGEVLEASLDLVEGVEVVVVHRREVQAEETGNSVEVSGGCLQREQATYSVAADSGSRDLVLVHEAQQVVSHRLVFEVFDVVRVAEVAGIHNPDVPVVEYLVSRRYLAVFVCEESDPVLGRVEDVWVEDQVREVFLFSGDVDAAQSDVAVVGLKGRFW